MSEIDEILALIKEKDIKFPIKVGVLSRSVRELTEAGLNLLDYITEESEIFTNAEDLEEWLKANKNKKHIVLMPQK